jgi:hypothetical protein
MAITTASMLSELFTKKFAKGRYKIRKNKTGTKRKKKKKK